MSVSQRRRIFFKADQSPKIPTANCASRAFNRILRKIIHKLLGTLALRSATAKHFTAATQNEL